MQRGINEIDGFGEIPNYNQHISVFFWLILKFSTAMNRKLCPLERRMPELSFIIWKSGGKRWEFFFGHSQTIRLSAPPGPYTDSRAASGTALDVLVREAYSSSRAKSRISLQSGVLRQEVSNLVRGILGHCLILGV